MQKDQVVHMYMITKYENHLVMENKNNLSSTLQMQSKGVL